MDLDVSAAKWGRRRIVVEDRSLDGRDSGIDLLINLDLEGVAVLAGFTVVGGIESEDVYQAASLFVPSPRRWWRCRPRPSRKRKLRATELDAGRFEVQVEWPWGTTSPV